MEYNLGLEQAYIHLTIREINNHLDGDQRVDFYWDENSGVFRYKIVDKTKL